MKISKLIVQHSRHNWQTKQDEKWTNIHYVTDDDTPERGSFYVLQPDGTTRFYHPNEHDHDTMVSYEVQDIDESDMNQIFTVTNQQVKLLTGKLMKLKLIQQVVTGGPSDVEDMHQTVTT
jgi:hypothetical protein